MDMEFLIKYYKTLARRAILLGDSKRYDYKKYSDEGEIIRF